MNLTMRVKELEQLGSEAEETRANLLQQRQQDTLELMTLKKACAMQKKDIETLEERINDLKDEMHHDKIEADERMSAKTAVFDKDKAEQAAYYTGELQKQEEMFLEERTRLKEQLHNVTSNEINLLNRIKCLEAEEGYSHAEVERILVKERELNEKHQEFQIRIESLERQLEKAREELEVQKSQVKIERDQDDIRKIEEQAKEIQQLTVRSF